jgi:hypothetical protein
MSHQEMVQHCGKSAFLIEQLLSSMFLIQIPCTLTDFTSTIQTGINLTELVGSIVGSIPD